MRQLLAVLRPMVRSQFGISVFKWRYIQRRERLWEPLLILFALGFAVLTLVLGIYRVSSLVAGASLGHPELVLGMGAAAVQIMTFFFGLFMVISAFYFSGEIQMLVPLPIRQGALISAKFASVLAGQYLTVAVFFVPVVAGYAQHAPFGPAKALVSLIVFLLLPVVPLALASAVSLVMMRFLNRKHRDLLMVLFSVLLIVLIIALQVFTQGAAAQDPEQYVYRILGERLGLLREATRRFPPALWAAVAIHDFPALGGLWNLLLTALSSLVSVVAMGILGERLFFAGLLGGGEAGSRKKPRARRHSTLLSPPNSPLRALVARELRLFLRTPIWVLNGLAPAVIAPVALLIPFIATGESKQIIMSMLASPRNQVMAGAGMAMMLLFIGCVNTVASTSVSREGNRLWISRTIPQSPEMQVDAKMLMAVLTTILAAVPPVVIFAIVFSLGLVHVILPALIGVFGSITGLAVGLRLDVSRPMLKWDNPQEPVKRNLNAIVPMIVAFGYLGLGLYMLPRLLDAGLGAFPVYSLMLGITLVTAAASWTMLRRGAVSAYARLEA